MVAGPDPERHERTGPLGALRRDLRDGLAAHLRYVAVSTAFFFLSVPVGAVAVETPLARSRLPLSSVAGIVFPRDGSALALLETDLDAFALLVLGAFTLGVLTAVALVSQGLVAGYFVAAFAGPLGPGYLFVALVPHGIPKLIGFVLAAAVSFRLVARAAFWVAGSRPFLDDREWRQSGLVLLCGFCSLALAALIEAHVTVRLADVLF
ncbi:MAG: stage II sporulation protein M [Natrialbaceae archaeon]